RPCGKVKREQLEFLADNTHFTKRFAYFVGRRCRQATIKDVAKELNLDWDAIKELDMQYMAAQLARAGTPGPKVIGIDEISIRKGHTYRIVVSDLLRRRPIWFGGTNRSEASMAAFYDWLGPKKSEGIRLGGRGRWEAFPHRAGGGGPKGRVFFRKIPHGAPLGGGARGGPKERVRPPLRPRAPLHQRAEVHAPLAPGEPVRERQASA